MSQPEEAATMTEIETNREDVKRGRWTKEDIAELRQLLIEDRDRAWMARKFRRSIQAVEVKAVELGFAKSLGLHRYRSIEPIARLVAPHFNLSVPALRGRAHFPHIVWPRQIAMWLAVRADRCVSHIGRYFDRDHATVLHGWGKVERLRRRDDSVRELTDALLATVRGIAPAPPPAPIREPEPPPPPRDDESAASDALVPFYEPVGGSGAKNTRAFLEEQNERFAAAMRAALEGTPC